ncbi:3-phosphoshikimate 1-carboxyvinyltransferase, chloroplastic [Vitis vinifera]|uniref:3-phosphoshikimate 1-carboxyvinyltransferase, chloroplastic n=1 Tax=Vitis vinifera TaxID=29760 RepID=A0A438GXE8_VITVI|nr:3-phosphoshikimate 1-carboxyvinyltransferase, chloroplastic [Vitis vinifera]
MSIILSGNYCCGQFVNSEDVHYMLGALRTLGLHVEEQSENKRVIVQGCGGQFPAGNGSVGEVQLFLGNAGTAMRPLTAAVTAAGGNASYVLDGVPRMRERPIGDLVTGLKQLGADVNCFLEQTALLFVLMGMEPSRRKVKLSGSISSQYLTALLMAAPLALGDVEIEIIDKLISIPYVEMTLKLMERFGPVAAVTGGTVTVEGCGTSSLQCHSHRPTRDSSGRKHLRAIDVNMNKMPDVAMTLAVVALYADGPTAIRDVASWRVKETERMIAICTELRKSVSSGIYMQLKFYNLVYSVGIFHTEPFGFKFQLGATVEEGPDYC